jgi:hypothetical protein
MTKLVIFIRIDQLQSGVGMSLRKFKIFAPLIISISLISPQDIAAGQRVELGIQGGSLSWNKGQSKISDPLLGINRTMIRDNNEYFGLIIGAYPSKFAGFEFGFLGGRWDYDLSLYYRDTLHGIDSSELISTIDCNEVFFAYGNVVLQPWVGRFIPYATVGAGYMNSAFDFDFIYNFGGGLKFTLSKHLLIRADLRIFESRVKSEFPYFITSGPPADWGWAKIPFEDKIKFRQITAGLVYYVQR